MITAAQFLQDEYHRRQVEFEKYSMAKFAADLGVGRNSLADVLQERRKISFELANKISQSLQVSPEEYQIFIQSHDIQGRPPLTAMSARAEGPVHNPCELMEKNFNEFKDDIFRVISEWQHLGILELTFLSCFKSSYNWMAQTLSITPDQVKLSVERLFRLGLLEEKDGEWIATGDYSKVEQEIPAQAIRKFHSHLIQKASEALLFQDLDERDFSTLFFAFDHKDLPQAKEDLKQFRREFMRKYSNSKTGDRIYCLGLHFFNLTENLGKTDH